MGAAPDRARRALNALRRAEELWFPAAPAARLALVRVVVGLYVIYYLGVRYDKLVAIAGSDPAHFRPVGVAVLLDGPAPAAAFQALLVVTLLANVAFVLGAVHRISGPLFAVALLCVLSYRNSWSMVYHSQGLVVFHVLVLGIAPAADAYSLDAYWRRTEWLTARERTGHWRYGWPLMLVCAVTAAVYFLSGVAKVAGPLGWSWADGEQLRRQVAVDALRKDMLVSGSTTIFPLVYEQVWLFTLMGVGTLVLELGAPLALLHRRLAQAWAVAAFFVHWGIFAVMGISFRYQLCGAAFAAFFPLEKPVEAVLARIARWRRPAGPPLEPEPDASQAPA